MVAVERYDLEAAAQQARPLVGPGTTVLPLLNGLEADERLAAILGEGPVLAGLTHISSSVGAPGLIRQVSQVRRITFGERDGQITARARQIRDVLTAGGTEVVLTSQVDLALWEKFVFIASIGSVCCIARQPIGPVLAVPESRALYVRALEEVFALGIARGVALSASVVEATLHFTEGLLPSTRPSLLVDLEAGRRLELEALSGTVVRTAEKPGCPLRCTR